MLSFLPPFPWNLLPTNGIQPGGTIHFPHRRLVGSLPSRTSSRLPIGRPSPSTNPPSRLSFPSSLHQSDASIDLGGGLLSTTSPHHNRNLATIAHDAQEWPPSWRNKRAPTHPKGRAGRLRGVETSKHVQHSSVCKLPPPRRRWNGTKWPKSSTKPRRWKSSITYVLVERCGQHVLEREKLENGGCAWSDAWTNGACLAASETVLSARNVLVHPPARAIDWIECAANFPPTQGRGRSKCFSIHADECTTEKNPRT